MAYEIIIIQEGYFMEQEDGTVKKNCTCTLIKGNINVIVDTLTPWDNSKIVSGLSLLFICNFSLISVIL